MNSRTITLRRPRAVVIRRRWTYSRTNWERMVAFYDFPEDHWKHLRTTNVVESPFAALRLRTTTAKRFKRVESATALIWKLLSVAEKRFRRLDAPHLLKDVFEGRKFEDGKPVSTPTAEECRLIRLHTY